MGSKISIVPSKDGDKWRLALFQEVIANAEENTPIVAHNPAKTKR